MNPTRRARLLAVSLAVPLAILAPLAACGTEGGSGSASEGTSSTTLGTGADLPAECSCLATPCGADLCPVIAASCPTECGVDFAVDEAALTCALEALRDGTPGAIRWSFTPAPASGDEGVIYILADRLAIRGVSSLTQGCGTAEATVHGPLPGPAVYEACLASASQPERFDCARQALAAVGILCVPSDNACD